MDHINTPLSDEEIELLEQILLYRIDEDVDTLDMDEGILDISTLDGFMTAIVSGPNMIPPSKWLPAVWGDFEPVWEDMEMLEDAFTLMIRHMNSIAAILLDYPDEFEPLFWQREVEDTTYLIVDEWCEGYRRGVELSFGDWNAGGEEMTIMLAPIFAFTQAADWPGHDHTGKELDALHRAIVTNVRDIHAYWLARRDEQPLLNRPERRIERKVGRNDPCPCGSGKKYKKCCLH
ncbi:MAG: UPF0149 family protein [Candidatus Thiodiazotropha sp. (ex Semelilucina semeliformis)]|nr:UPF0149 family protein [Candidatus Thiodiazotropha sp. (ex Semelilucina semeliformis)]